MSERSLRALLATIPWLLAALLGAWLTARHDALVALGMERWSLPLRVAGAQLGLLVLWTPVAWWLVGPEGRPRLIALPGIALVALWLAVLRDPPAEPARAAGRASGPDIVLVTLDTFRADHFGALVAARGGQGPSLTPELDQLAAGSLLFTQAVTSAPLTGPAHASMLTGLDAHSHGLSSNGRELEAESLVPRLASAGYATGAFVSSRVLDRHSGLHQGFAHYDDAFDWRSRLAFVPGAARWLGRGRKERGGDETIARASRWYAAQDGPAFLWVHLYDAHMPYAPPDAFAPTEEELARARAADRERRRGAERLVDAVEGAHVEEGKLMYAAEVRHLDHLVGQLLAVVPEDAVLIVLADHGESLDEHGYYFNHGALLHEPALHIPMLVRWPGRVEPGLTDRLVGVADVAPTLLYAAGLVEDPGLLQAAHEEILAWTPGQQNRRVASRGPGRRGVGQPRRASAAIRLDGAKIGSSEAGPVQWFDLVSDPGELAPAEPPPEQLERARRVEALVHEVTDELEPEERARLEALGYVD